MVFESNANNNNKKTDTRVVLTAEPCLDARGRQSSARPPPFRSCWGASLAFYRVPRTFIASQPASCVTTRRATTTPPFPLRNSVPYSLSRTGQEGPSQCTSPLPLPPAHRSTPRRELAEKQQQKHRVPVKHIAARLTEAREANACSRSPVTLDKISSTHSCTPPDLLKSPYFFFFCCPRSPRSVSPPTSLRRYRPSCWPPAPPARIYAAACGPLRRFYCRRFFFCFALAVPYLDLYTRSPVRWVTPSRTAVFLRFPFPSPPPSPCTFCVAYTH